MSGFDVDPAELEAAAVTVRRSTSGAEREAATAPPGPLASGDSHVAAALARLSSAWDDGTRVLVLDVESTATSLGLSALTYTAADERAAALLQAAGRGS